MPQFRRDLLSGAIGGILLFSWSLVLGGYEDLMSSMTGIIALIVSIVLMVGLYGLATRFVVVGVYHLMTLFVLKTRSRTDRRNVLLKWFGLTGLFGVMSFIATLFVMDLGFGKNIRALPFWSFLPDDNLLVTGGPDGWTYLTLFVLVVIALRWNKDVARLQNRMKVNRSMQSVPSFERLKPTIDAPNPGIESLNDNDQLRQFLASRP